MSIRVGKINGPITFWEDRDFSVIEADFLSQGAVNSRGTNDDLKVIQRAAGANMSVDVNTGIAYITINKLGKTWKVRFENLATVNVAIPANSSGVNRVDAIIARVDVDVDPDASSSNLGTIERVAGSGISALSDAAIQATISSDAFIRLANVTVADSATSIVTANIANTRPEAQIGIDAGGYKTKFRGDGSLLAGIINNPVSSDILPDTDDTRDIGSNALRFNEVYVKQLRANQIFKGGTELGNKFGGTGTDGALALANTAGTGTMATSGTNVTGVGTAFTSEVAVGDRITVSGQTRIVATVPGNTSLTVTVAFSPDVVVAAAFTIGKDTVIDLANNAVVVKNYTTMSITGTTKLKFSNPHANGTFIFLKSQGNVTITSTATPAIDATGMGASGSGGTSSGGAGGGALLIECGGSLNFTGIIWSKGLPGTAGAGTVSSGGWISTSGGGTGAALIGSGPGGGHGGSAGVTYDGAAGPAAGLYGNNYYVYRVLQLITGAGGGQGGSADSGASYGGGGGGGGGSVAIFYNALTTNTGTIVVTGGTGGASGAGGAGGGGGGGSNTAGAARSGNTGGNGGDGLAFVTPNTDFS